MLKILHAMIFIGFAITAKKEAGHYSQPLCVTLNVPRPKIG
jgi:hypothetical protein